MTETPETPTVRHSAATAPAPVAEEPVRRTPRVFLGAAWVAIVAGIVFIVAVIFFTGYSLGRHSGHGGYHHGHHKHHGMMYHRHGPGGAGGPGATTPGGAPSVSPSPGPGQVPSSVAPTTTR
jgi:hypothetical protein